MKLETLLLIAIKSIPGGAWYIDLITWNAEANTVTIFWHGGEFIFYLLNGEPTASEVIGGVYFETEASNLLTGILKIRKCQLN